MFSKQTWTAYGIALLSDVAIDFFSIWGLLPIVGDIVDIFTIATLYPTIGTYALIGAGEIIPALDFLPLHTAAVFMWDLSNTKGVSSFNKNRTRG